MNEKEIRDMYRENVRQTAPDMERLWNRIEQKIDEADKTESPALPQREITVSKGGKNTFTKALGWAAAFVIVFSAGAFILNRNTVEKDKSQSSGKENYSAEIDEYSYSNISPSEELSAENEPGEAEPGNETQEIGGHDIKSETAPAAVDYSKLALDHSAELLTADYAPRGDDFFVESQVLAETETFLDCKVEKVEQDKSFCTYTLTVIECWTKSAEYPSGSTLTLVSTSPLLLAEGGEYLLPVTLTDEGLRLVFENAPQIEYTLDGSVVFHNGWKTLNEGSQECIYPENSKDKFFYDRMRITSKDKVETLITRWQEL